MLSLSSHSSPDGPFGPASVAASAVVVVTVTPMLPSKPAAGVTLRLPTRDCTSARLAPAVLKVQVPAGSCTGAPVGAGKAPHPSSPSLRVTTTPSLDSVQRPEARRVGHELALQHQTL